MSWVRGGFKGGEGQGGRVVEGRGRVLVVEREMRYGRVWIKGWKRGNRVDGWKG